MLFILLARSGGFGHKLKGETSILCMLCFPKKQLDIPDGV